MSICSNASSVSYAGEEVEIDVAIDDVFLQIQRSLNDAQMSLRSLAMSSEQDCNFQNEVELSDQIFDNVTDMISLFRELKSISRQVIGKPTNDEDREWFKMHTAQRKAEKTKKE